MIKNTERKLTRCIWSKSFINDTLSIYIPEYRYIDSAYSIEHSTYAELSISTYPFTKPGHIDYITASMANLAVAQIGYIHIRHLVLNDLDPYFSELNDNWFCVARDTGNVVLGKLNIKYRKKLKVKNAHKCVLSHTHTSKRKNSYIGAFNFSIGDSAIVGDGIITVLPVK
jgi:hypothetical protein